MLSQEFIKLSKKLFSNSCHIQKSKRVSLMAFAVALVCGVPCSSKTLPSVNKVKYKPLPIPHLAKNEFAIFSGTAYKALKTVEIDELILSSDCIIKGSKPTCLAYKASGNPLAGKEVKFNGNPASDLCTNIEGQNLIALNSLQQEFNFCEFKDGSMVNSWSLYYKINPKILVNRAQK